MSEYHTGYRAFRSAALEAVNLEMNSDRFIFDQEIMAQMVELKLRFKEIAVPTRYFAEASSASFLQSVVYGLSLVWLMFRYFLHRKGICGQRQFDSLAQRYSDARVAANARETRHTRRHEPSR